MQSVPHPHRSLIVAPSTLTAALQTQPLIAALKGRDPASAIDVLCQPPLAPVFRAMSAVNDLIESPLTAEDLAPWARIRLSWRLAARRYDRAYVLDEAATSAFAPWLARIPERHLHPSHADGLGALDFPGDVQLAGRLRPPQLDRAPRLDEGTARQLELSDDGAPLILLAPASELGPNREWPARHYATLAREIRRRWPTAAIGLLGSARDRALTTRIALVAGAGLRNWAGSLDTGTTLAVIARASALVSGESALMHVAAALGRPHVAIYGAGDPRAERVADRRRTVLWLRLACGPCEESHCPRGHLNCLYQQSPDSVLEALGKMLRFSAMV